MSYSEDAVNAKLSALNETQESIVTTAQWVMFHKRHADRTIKIWYDKLGTSSPSKRLNLIYLINEIAQQSKFRRKEEFRTALANTIADGVSVAYSGATNDIKNKIKRVIDVWKDRETFDENVRDDIDRRVDAIDRKRGEMRRPLMGSGSTGLSNASIPEELQELVKFQTRAQKAFDAVKTTTEATKGWEDSMNTIDLSTASALNAARINGIHDKLLQAHAAAVESVVSRKAIVDELNKLLQAHKSILAEHQNLVEDFTDKKEKTSRKKTEVENAILAKMHYEKPWEPLDKPAEFGNLDNGYREPERPQVEALTPPAADNDDDDEYNPPEINENGNGSGTPPAMFGFEDAVEDETNGDEVHPSKKRKLDDHNTASFMGDGSDTLEMDVEDLIRSESGS